MRIKNQSPPLPSDTSSHMDQQAMQADDDTEPLELEHLPYEVISHILSYVVSLQCGTLADSSQIPRSRTDPRPLLSLADTPLCRLGCDDHTAPSTDPRPSRRWPAVSELFSHARNVHAHPSIRLHSRPRPRVAAMDTRRHGPPRRPRRLAMATSLCVSLPPVLETV